MTTALAFDRLLEPVVGCLTPEAARRLVEFRIDAETQRRLDDWAEKANEGRLSDVESREYGAFIAALDFVGILQAKARRVLGQRISP